MRKLACLAAVAVGGVAVVGCQVQEPPKPATSKSVLDVRPAHKPSPTFAMSPQIVTPPEEPRPAVVSAPMTTVTPEARGGAKGKQAKADKTAKTAGEGTMYKVKKGDTLYHIAKAEYGDGKKWTVIASANPGITPQSLKVGQTLIIP